MKNKAIRIIIILPLMIYLNSCNKRLDIPPINILTNSGIFSNDPGIDAYMASLYNALPMDDFNMYPVSGALPNQTDASITSFSDQNNNALDGTQFPWWGYNNVRNVNALMEQIPTANVSDITKQSLLGEAYFLRAYYYFAMVKRYGGIPIIRNVENFTGSNLADLQVKRDNEKDVYDFIGNDLDSAALLLGPDNEKGRATKYEALALKSRVMLYAASSAEYGQVLLNGVVGIPSSDADKYWQEAYDAANAVITSGQYSLYNKYPDDKVKNFSSLFLDDDNPEIIFARYFSYPQKVHGYDCWYLPFGVRGPDGYSSRMCPTLEAVEQFEYIDGTKGTLKIADASGNPIFYKNPTDLFLNKDPRCLATIIVPFSTWEGATIDVQAGIYDQGVKWEAGNYSSLYNVNTHQPDDNGTLHIVGQNGFGGSEITQTGFYIRKYLNSNESKSRATYGGSDQTWIDMRYGEVLLNYAEAAIELGKVADSKLAVNEVRERAGIALLNDADVTIDKVRHERLVELAFENQRYWDYKRWHIADRLLTNTWPHALKPYYDVQAKAYRFEESVAGRFPKTFNPRAYYQMIDPGEIAKNPNLVQNPNY